MSDVNPVLLLTMGLLGLGALIGWCGGMYVAVKIARRSGRRALAYLLPAMLAGPVFAAAVYLARSYRRSAAVWVSAQAGSIAAVLAACVLGGSRILGISLALDLLALLLGMLAALSPLIVLAVLGPARGKRVEMPPDRPLIQASNLHKSYGLGRQPLHVLRGVSLSVKRGEFVAILGASGSGKSTLLHLLGLLDSTDRGRISLEGIESAALSAAERDRIRCRDIGFVFQFYHLLPELNVLENALLPAMTAQGPWRWSGTRRQMRQRAREILQRLGLADRLKHRPRELSGGEQQRVAIARALMNSPKILFADEPTGNLDSKTGGQILKLLKQLNAETEQTIVMVTHDQALAGVADRVLHLRDGRLH